MLHTQTGNAVSSSAVCRSGYQNHLDHEGTGRRGLLTSRFLQQPVQFHLIRCAFSIESEPSSD
jgi:hypothetical protein